MKITAVLFIAAIFSFLIAARNSSDPFDLQLVIQQKGKDIAVNDTFSKITLARMPFSLFFNSLPYDTIGNKFYATRIAVTLEKKEIKEIATGKSIDDIPYFSPGTGTATLGPYEKFYLNGGHQYIIYETEGERRASLVSEDNGLLRLTCDVPALFGERTIEFSSKNINRFYMIVLSDMNLNGIVDAGEFRAIEIDLQ
ncbi:MAG TPA: hypothetical protein VE978_17450 [Chitinophagales bacterium]|nr:hypothetical protein [Chitinophagales bacterium]